MLASSRVSRAFVALLAAIVVAGLGLGVAHLLFAARRGTQAATLARAQRDLAGLQRAQVRYQALTQVRRQVTDRAQTAPAGMTLLEIVDRLAAEAEVGQRPTFARPQESLPVNGHVESTLEVHFDGMTLRSLVGFLAAVEKAGPYLEVLSCTIARPLTASDRLRVTLTLRALHPASAPPRRRP